MRLHGLKLRSNFKPRHDKDPKSQMRMILIWGADFTTEHYTLSTLLEKIFLLFYAWSMDI